MGIEFTGMPEDGKNRFQAHLPTRLIPECSSARKTASRLPAPATSASIVRDFF